MGDVKKSRRGVYYDLTISPYEYVSPYGDIFKFSSKKKLEIYTRDVKKEIKNIDIFLNKHGIHDFIPCEIVNLIKRAHYKAFYKTVER